MIDEEKFTAAVQDQIKLVKAETKIFASKIVDMHVDFAQKNAPELIGQVTNLQQAKENFIKVHRRLITGISQIDPNLYDLILIDCPPNFNIVTKNAIVASDCILIPAKPDYLSTLGIDYLKKSLDRLVKEYNEYCEIEDDDDDSSISKISPKILGVIFTMVQFYGGEPISAIRPFISQTKKLGIHVFENYFRENKTLFADAPQYGIPVVLEGRRADIVKEIENFVTEFERLI